MIMDADVKDGVAAIDILKQSFRKRYDVGAGDELPPMKAVTSYTETPWR